MAFPSNETLSSLITPIIEQHGFDLEQLKTNKAGKKSSVLIAVDADQRPDLDTLEVLSNAISELFDAKESAGELNFGAGYTLEVSTPGVDTPLSLPRHWRRNQGRLVSYVQDGKKHVARIGALNDAQTHVIVVTKVKKTVVVDVLELAQHPQAVVEIEFAQPDAQELEVAQEEFEVAAQRRGENK